MACIAGVGVCSARGRANDRDALAGAINALLANVFHGRSRWRDRKPLNAVKCRPPTPKIRKKTMINVVASLSVSQSLTLQAASSNGAGRRNPGVAVSGTVEVETSVEISLSAQRLKDAREALDMLNRLLDTLRSGGDSRWMKLGQLVDRTFDRLVEANADTVIFGTGGNDTINARSNSAVYGRGGNDVISAWSRSYVDGGAGNDTLKTWSGSVAHGGSGDDVIDVWSDSHADGGAGNDVIRAWSGSVADGRDGDDVIQAWSDSYVDGGAGNDVIKAWSGSTVHGGAGNDVIDVWSNSTVHGGAGNDVIKAWSGSTVHGGAGDDVIDVWSNSTVHGGTGNDVISLGGDSTAIFDVGDGHDVVTTKSNDVIRFGSGLGVDQIRFSFDGDNTIITFDGNEQDSITLTQRGPGNGATLAFADGTTIKVPVNPDSLQGRVAAMMTRTSGVNITV
jgi:hypothetical protein